MQLGDWLASWRNRLIPHLPQLTDREAMTWGAVAIGIVFLLGIRFRLKITSRERLKIQQSNERIRLEEKAQENKKFDDRRKQLRDEKKGGAAKPPMPPAGDQPKTELDEFLRRKAEEDKRREEERKKEEGDDRA